MAKNDDELLKLQAKVKKLEKINKALMDRVESAIDLQGNAFSLFEGNILLQREVAEKSKELEEAKDLLLQQKKSLDAVVMISHTNAAGVVQEVNQKFCQISGYEREEFIGKNLKILNSGMHSSEFWSKFWETIKSGFTFRGEVCNKSKSGDLFWEEKVVLPTFHEEKGIIGFIAVSIDITAKKQSERMLFHQAKLISIGEMASGIGHEINNPLTVSVGNTLSIKKELLDMGFHNNSILEKIDKICEANDRISKIVYGLRTYSRDDTDKEEVISINDVISSTLNLVKDIYEKDGVKILFEVSPESLFVLGHKGKLQQIVMNLISNARDALEEIKKKQIIVKCESDDQYVTINVIDNGCGIPQNVIGEILNPFFTTKRAGKGTGIGLSFVNEEIKKIGGELKIQSVENKGSTFQVILPLTQKPQEKEQAEQDENISLSGNVLIVDDEEGIREILADILEDIGLNVEQADDGDTALEKVKEKNYDFICTDMKMKRMQGDQFIINAKKHISEDCAVFIITGGVTENYMESNNNVLSDLINGQIDKPFTPKTIAKVLKNFKKAA